MSTFAQIVVITVAIVLTGMTIERVVYWYKVFRDNYYIWNSDMIPIRGLIAQIMLIFLVWFIIGLLFSL